MEEDILKTEADFWKFVQGPSTRLKDRERLCNTAFDALSKFEKNPYIVASATIVILYRSVEPSAIRVVSDEKLEELIEKAFGRLCAEQSFNECRWFISLSLASAAFAIGSGNNALGQTRLNQVTSIFDLALSHGQLFTNVTKSTLMQLALASKTKFSTLPADSALALADHVLEQSQHLVKNYKFSNQFAYEEVAFVYSMLRQIYNWQNISRKQEHELSLHEIENMGFLWRIIGSPFKTLI